MLMYVSLLVITPRERKLLGVFTFLGVLIVGPLAGAVLALNLEDEVLLPAYWSTLLTVQGVSALPLVAIAALVSRTLVVDPTQPNPLNPPGPSSQPKTPFWAKSILLLTLLALMAAVAVVMLCLFQIALTSAPTADAPGEPPNQGVLWVTSIGAAMTICAVAAAVLAVALDKIDDKGNT